MRVSNERAKSAIKAHHITGSLTTIVKDYAADLLEARAIIEKQAELIRDAYTQMNQIQMYTAESQVFERIQIWGKTFTDRTKDYAE